VIRLARCCAYSAVAENSGTAFASAINAKNLF